MDERGSSILGERGSEVSSHGGTASVIADLQLSVNTGWTLNMAYLIFCTQRDPSRGASKLIICSCFVLSHAMWICYVRSRRYKSQKHKKYFNEGNYENH